MYHNKTNDKLHKKTVSEHLLPSNKNNNSREYVIHSFKIHIENGEIVLTLRVKRFDRPSADLDHGGGGGGGELGPKYYWAETLRRPRAPSLLSRICTG